MGHTDNKAIGKIGEDLAAKYLADKGYQIIKRNWGSKWGEIDIIAQNKNTLVFVEVKTKVGEDWGSPEAMVDKRKLFQVQRIAQLYNPSEQSQRRIDVLAVVLNEDLTVKRLNHYEAVY